MRALALLLLAPALAVASKPAFCKSYDCPAFTSQALADNVELRTYSPSTWASTSNSGNRQKRGMFMKLFRYIQGDNVQDENIPMTVPVLTKVEPSSTSMMFYMPGSPPQPRQSDVSLVNMGTTAFYVHTFRTYGWTSQGDYDEAAAELKAELTAQGRTWNQNVEYQVGYDSPWTFFRHNEIWLETTQQ